MPVNVFVSKPKVCVITFEYGYADSDVRWSRTCSYTVKAANDPVIEVSPLIAVGEADGIVRDPVTEKEWDRTFKINVTVTGNPEKLPTT